MTEMSFQFHAQILNSLLIISDCTCCKPHIEFINKHWNQAVRIHNTRLDHTLLHIEVSVNQGPLELMLNLVRELWCLAESPLPLTVALINLHQFRNLPQFFLVQNDLVHIEILPLTLESKFEGITEVVVVDLWSDFFQIHDS